MKSNHNRENLALVIALTRSHQQFMRVITPLFKRADLTPSQWDILETLYNKGSLSVNELISTVLSSSGNLDVVIKNLIKAGLVTKVVAEHDSRSRMISLTDAGRAKVDSFYPEHNQALEDIFRHLPVGDKQQLIKDLNKLRKQLASHYEEIKE